MKSDVLADATAIVGVLSSRDQHSVQASAWFKSLDKPLYTCEAVITEVLFLVKQDSEGRQRALGFLEDGILRIGFDLADELEAVRYLMKKYDSVPMSLADACLVRMSEMRGNSEILTFDQDFRIYRKFGRQIIPVIGLDG